MFQIRFLDIEEAKNIKDNALVNETKGWEDAQSLTVASDGKLPTKKRKRVSRACKNTLLAVLILLISTFTGFSILSYS
jgi:hypothetical protein